MLPASRIPATWLFLILLGEFAGGVPVKAQTDIDSASWTAAAVDRIDRIDAEMQQSMQTIGATSATLAISRHGHLLYSRGYGFCDRRGEVATSPQTMMRLASCTKPLTAAAIRILVERGDLALETPVYDYLGIRPAAELADPRVRQITVAHLLQHRGGWDRQQTFDSMYHLAEIRRSLKLPRLQKRHIVRFMWEQPLQFDPGARRAYSNFGYLLLGLVIEKATGRSFVEAIRDLVAEPIGADDVFLSSAVPGNRQRREVYYPEDSPLNLHLRDSASGLATSAESLCRFMEHFWMDGGKRNVDRQRYYFQIGSHPFTTTTIMEQRLDGINYAIMLNRRRNEHFEEDNHIIRHRFNEVLDAVAAEWPDRAAAAGR
jgi:N-acyl-D-amino-acid deacylase